MQQYGISQLPVTENGSRRRRRRGRQHPGAHAARPRSTATRRWSTTSVVAAMDPPFPRVAPERRIDEAFEPCSAARRRSMIVEGEHPVGVITRSDLLEFVAQPPDAADQRREHRRHGLATRAMHVGQGPDPSTGAVVVPIHLATTFAQELPGGTRASTTRAPATRRARPRGVPGLARQCRSTGSPSSSAWPRPRR